MRIKALIIDDEPLARQRFHALLSSDPDIEIIGECECGDENTALCQIKENQPGRLFLDGLKLISGQTKVDQAKTKPEWSTGNLSSQWQDHDFWDGRYRMS